MDKALIRIKKDRGAVARLGKALGIDPSAISQWRRVPAERVPAVEAATGIPRHELRPDLWEAPGGAGDAGR
jgi:DNA-binding transcriptional regulator YdaS (Cro superfamily)